MASDNEASCIADPNFAVICGFLQKFGTSCGLSSIDFIDLQKMIENTQEVPQPLVDLHLKLLRRIKKTVAIERWEKVLSKVCHTYNNQDGWEIERFGYKKARISCKLRTLKTLLEMQFDCYTKFKNEINKLSADDLRSQPLGRDKLGHAYWCQIDADCQIRIYKEDPDEETWMLVARDREGLLSLISQLKENDSVITGIEPVLNEDSNSLEIEKPILDTGQADSTSEHKPDEKPEDDDKQTDEIEITIENGKEEPEAKKEELPKPIGIRLKPMSELLNSPNAAQYKADEEAKKKRNNDEAVENPKPAKSRKLTLMNSKPVKKRIEESSEDDDDMDEDDEDMDDEDDSDEISEEIEEPVVYIRGRGRGKDNCTGNVQSSPIIGEEISEDILYVYGEGAGKDCQTGNENNDDKSSKEQTKKSTIKLGMVIDSRADKMGESATKAPTKKNRWDVGKPTDNDDKEAGKSAAKVSMFFFGPNTNANAGISFFGASSSPAKDSDSNSKSAEDSQNPKDHESDNNIDNSKSNDENSVINHKTHFGEALEKELNIPRTGNQVSDESSQETPIVPARTISEDLSKAVVENETGKEMEVATTNNENVFKDEDRKEINVLITVENPIYKVKDKSIPIVTTNIEKPVSKDFEGENKGTEEQKKESSDNNLVHSLNMKEIAMKSRLEGDKLMVEASSAACDISKEETRRKPEETAVKSIELNSSTTNASSNTLDELSAKAFASSENDNLSKSDNVRTTKENMVYSNTMITEMEIEDAIEIADPNIGDRSGESMEIEALVTKTDQEKSGENMEIEEIQKGEGATKQKSLGELIQEAKLTHSCIDTSLAQKDKVILETSTSIESTEALSIDLSTTDDSKTTTMDIEESSDSITITINKTTECLSVSQDTDKVSKDTVLPESILKELATTTTSSEMEIATENDKEQKVKYLETQSDEQIEDLSTKKRGKIKDVELAKEILSSIESCIVQTSGTTLTNIEAPAIIVSTDASVVKEPECVKKAIAPLTNTEDSAAKKKALDKPSDVEKKAASPLQSIQSVESIDADCHASSIDRESEIDTAEDPLDNVGIPPDDPLGLAEQEQAAEDEIDEAEEEEIDEEEEEEEIDPEALDDEEADGGDDEGLDEEEMEDEELEGEEEEEEDEDDEEDDATKNPPPKGPKIITPTKDKKATLTSFSMDFNDSSDSLNLPPMLKEKLKKRQLMQNKELLKGKSADSDHSDQVDEEDSNDEEVEEEEDQGGEEEEDEDDSDEAELPPPKGKVEELKQVRPLVKGAVRKLPLVAPPVQAEKKSTTADLRKERKKKKSEVEILQEEIEVKSALVSGVRQSRRIAQIKIREEAEKRKLEDLTLAQVKFESRKMFENAEKIKKGKLSSDEEYIDLDDAKKKMKKKKKHKRSRFDEYNPWKSSSEEECEESAEEEQEEEMADDSDHYREPKSDHEFSPESDLEDGIEVKPLKRARTVRKEDKSEEDDQETDDTPCEKCGKFDHPEWILLCDGCDHGWHCSCLRPALLVIPEGDWFCPPCQHAKLLKQLELQLVDLDKRRSKQQIEVRRKERLAYVGISLNNVLATKDSDAKKDGNARNDSSSSGSSGSTDSSDSDEPIYQLRQRRQAHSYRFNDYDDLINSAIQDADEPEGEEAIGNQGRGKDIATIVNAEKEHDGDKPAKKVVKRKKKRKLNSLVVSSGEDGTSDEDFRGSSTEYDEDDQEFDEPGSSNSSYDSCMGRKRKKGGGATRRSTRARWSRMDTDFINDDTDDDLPDEPKKRQKRSKWTDDSDDLDEEDDLSELSDRSWGKKRKSGSTKRSSSKSNKTSKKKSRQIKRGSDSDEPVQKKKRKIKFGFLNDSDDADERKPPKVDSVRRTRGKKITYIDALGSDSEEEMRRRKAGIVEESEEEYVAEDDDGLEDEDGNEIEKDSDDSDSAAPTKIHVKPVAKKGKGKGGIKRIKRAQGIEDELFPPLKPLEEISEDATQPTKPEVSVTTSATKEDKPKSNDEETKEEDVDKSSPSEVSVDPMQEINRNMESMDEKLMMEDPDYATKQLQMVAAQLERKKKEEAAAAAAAEAAATSEDMAKHRRGRKPKVIPYMSPAPQILQAKLQQQQKEDPQLENTNSNSPDAAVIPSFGELSGTPSEDGSPMKKRRGRGKGKKTLEKEAAAAAALAAAATALGKEDLGKPPEDVLPVIKPTPTSLDPASVATAKLAIATPPQPFSQTEPTPSVITRMLQAPQAGPPCPGTPPGSSSPASAVIVPYGPGPLPPHKYYGPGLGPPPLVGDVGRPPPPPLRGAPPPHLPPGMPPHGIGGPPYGPPMNHRPYHGGPPGPGIALPPHMLQRATPAASHSPPMPAGAMYHHHHTVDASPSGGSAIQPPGSPGRIPGVAPPPTSVPSHLAGVPPDRHTPPPPSIGGGGPRYPPHAPHQPSPRQHPHHMVPPQLGMLGLPPRPVPPSGYPPSPYYAAYPSQPSGIPPEDYHHHHHHHHQQHHHHQHHHPPPPPSHGYSDGPPPPQPPLAVVPPPTTTTQPPPPPPTAATTTGSPQTPDPIPPAVSSEAAIVGGLKAPHHGGEVAVAPAQDSTGEFGGLVSYFSSQREDDLDG